MPSYVITGAARGLGYEFVQQLSNSPENLVFALVRAKNAPNKLVSLGRPNIQIVEADITDHKALKLAADKVSEITGGKLDVLINNAALVGGERSHLHLNEYTEGEENFLERDLKDSFDVNVVGVIHTINAFLPLLRAGGVRKVVTLSTGVADSEFTQAADYSTAAPYAISKAAVNMAVTKYAIQYKKEGFTFLAISPGLVNTATKEPTTEELKVITAMVNNFRQVFPYFKDAITPEVSVRMMLGVIENAKVKDTGSFISQKGNKEWL